ncbi:MAG: ribosome-associated translation inhibitor RaiA [Pseudomonadota bacterium]
MQIQFVSKQLDMSPALRERIEAKVEDGVAKYFNRPGEAYVVVTKEGFGFQVDCSLHLPSGAFLQATGKADDAYGAAEDAVGHLEKRLRRYKRRLKDHHADNKAELPAEQASIYVLRGNDARDDEDDDGGALGGEDPVIIAETAGELRTMTVGMAVHEMDLIGAPFLVFRNVSSRGVNIVYRRPDGNVGWIDPALGGKDAPGAAAE